MNLDIWGVLLFVALGLVVVAVMRQQRAYRAYVVAQRQVMDRQAEAMALQRESMAAQREQLEQQKETVRLLTIIASK
jgi:hypothetical protein